MMTQGSKRDVIRVRDRLAKRVSLVTKDSMSGSQLVYFDYQNRSRDYQRKHLFGGIISTKTFGDLSLEK